MAKDQLKVTCPVCGRKNEYMLAVLVEGAALVCPFCTLKLTLRGHMWEDIQNEVKKLKEEKGANEG
jgi:hypothetical protein